MYSPLFSRLPTALMMQRSQLWTMWNCRQYVRSLSWKLQAYWTYLICLKRSHRVAGLVRKKLVFQYCKGKKESENNANINLSQFKEKMKNFENYDEQKYLNNWKYFDFFSNILFRFWFLYFVSLRKQKLS